MFIYKLKNVDSLPCTERIKFFNVWQTKFLLLTKAKRKVWEHIRTQPVVIFFEVQKRWISGKENKSFDKERLFYIQFRKVSIQFLHAPILGCSHYCCVWYMSAGRAKEYEYQYLSEIIYLIALLNYLICNQRYFHLYESIQMFYVNVLLFTHNKNA